MGNSVGVEARSEGHEGPAPAFGQLCSQPIKIATDQQNPAPPTFSYPIRLNSATISANTGSAESMLPAPSRNFVRTSAFRESAQTKGYATHSRLILRHTGELRKVEVVSLEEVGDEDVEPGRSEEIGPCDESGDNHTPDNASR